MEGSARNFKLPFRFYHEDELVKRLKNVTLRESNQKPYEDSFITLERMRPVQFSPTQRYVMVQELQKIENIRGHYLDHYGMDIFNLVGFVETVGCDILPPVVEEHIINGQHHMIVADGQHRTYLAMHSHKLITVAFVRNVSCAYYAYPLRKGWDDVEVIEHLHKTYIKKYHINLRYKQYFRDYNSQFNNVSESRPVLKEGAKWIVDEQFSKAAKEAYVSTPD